ncbi:cupin domain-containing protein [uncultured Roseibium sp.]|uniref:cupin domain-containing protein n=1 Tax=uncultured Roseibium sp. TaxID=1936171 RepID=UPI003216371B
MWSQTERIGLKAALAAMCMTLPLMALPVHAESQFVRTELSRDNLSGSDKMEVVVSKLEVPPGATIPLHTHFGDEHMVVFEGGDMTAPNGKVINFKPGMTGFFPAGKVHGGLTNSGETPMVVYTTHILEKGKPFSTPAQ